MSYILEALRRSEQVQRAPASAPPVAAPDLPEEPRRRYVRVAIVLAALALAGAAAYYFYLAHGETPTVAAPSAPTLTTKRIAPDTMPAPAAPTAATEARQTGEEGREGPAAKPPPVLEPSPFVEPARRSEVRDLAEQLEVPRPPRVAEPTPVAPPPAPAAAGPRTTVIPGPLPAAEAPRPVARVDDGVKFLRAMPPEFRRELPELVVNIHIYVPNEADRILYINNRQYQAGDKVREDIRVEAIVEDGAVLSFRGQRFKLPRPS